jgi:signal peptidase I
MASGPPAQPGANDPGPQRTIVDVDPALDPIAGDGHGTGSPVLDSAEGPVDPEVATEASTPTPPSGRARRTKRGLSGSLRELPVLLLVAFLLALLIKSFVVQAFYIPSESMTNTLKVGDRVLVNKLVYHLHPPRRGDIIVFADPHPAVVAHRNVVSGFWHWLTEGLGVSSNPDKDFIKRVIGLPGETVEMNNGIVTIDGKPLREPYLNPYRDLRAFGPYKVPEGTLFVMGDNRANSSDSRFGLGPIPMDKVIGRAFVIIWPPSRVGWLHGL